MLNNIEGELFVFKSMNIKPNFSELSRLYGIDRHTVAKMWKNGGIKKLNRKPRKSRLDPYKTKIDELLSKPGVNIKGAYEYMTDHYGSDIIGSYNNFRHYIWKNDMKPIKNKEVHVRFETPPGVQMQVDWLCKASHNQSYEKKKVMRSY